VDGSFRSWSRGGEGWGVVLVLRAGMQMMSHSVPSGLPPLPPTSGLGYALFRRAEGILAVKIYQLSSSDLSIQADSHGSASTLQPAGCCLPPTSLTHYALLWACHSLSSAGFQTSSGLPVLTTEHSCRSITYGLSHLES
jgi:hypothetical protein